MQDFDSILLSQLRDIHGPTSVSLWPLAPGWWLLLFFLVSFIFVAVKKYLKIKKYRSSWRYKIECELELIATNADPKKAKENISRINDILKRLAIKLYGRKESAPLAGKRWLAWLSNHDPRNFNWLKKAEILIEYPYMPEEKIQASNEQISTIAKATRAWLKI